ncbi:MAG: phosphoglucomutase/phosphomannomutase family protein [Chitinophagales bacterium]|nr:phosphoglucomutase/phosphomannomutase family protein [Chitinophagales bacterium]MDW8392822.1 phosphoglucomutase/phosphomannomutase family protein [Chitinophagales bacterium]
MNSIKFGTDGWRAIIADDFTVENVRRVAVATARWVQQQNQRGVAVIGYDCRFGGELFARTAAQMLCAHNIKTYLAEGFVSTPMVSLAARHYGADIGVVITASHNPPSYNGYKLKGGHGGPSSPSVIAAVEALIPEQVSTPTVSLQTYEAGGLLEYVDMEALYLDHVRRHFDLELINQANFIVAYDAMFGAGQRVAPALLRNTILLHCDYNPSFKGQAPEPLDRNLAELASAIRNAPGNVVGLATDGDADRLGMYDETGAFVDAHHIILLLIHYLHRYKKMNGKVVVAFSVSDKVKKMCLHYGLPVEVTPIGFKYISEKMVKEDVLLGGEESGGIAVKGHIPERDGIWDGLLLLEFMARTGKSLRELIREVYDVVGSFSFNRLDLHLDEELKQKIIANCREGRYRSFGRYTILRTEDLDGFKYHFSNDEWVMIRPSGTEPLLRVYGEAPSSQAVSGMLQTVKQALLENET